MSDVVGYFAMVINAAILARVIMNWVRVPSDFPPYRLAFAITEPLMGPIRRIVYKSPLGGPGMALDFSPAIVMFLVSAASGIVQTVISAF